MYIKSKLPMIFISKKSMYIVLLANVSRVVQCQHPYIVFLTNTEIISDFSNYLYAALIYK